MFNSANVIFRTRFVDGVSAVTRTVVGGRDKARIAGASTGSIASSSSSSASASASAASEASSDQDLGEAKAPASKKGKKRTSSRSGAARSAGVENMVEA